jgi:uncharacterized protein YfaS (alpha-2-macroglobulin family)
LRRRIVLLAVSLSLLLGFVAVFLNVTETDLFLRRALRAFVPQQIQNVLRPLRAPMVIGFSPEWEATNVPLRSPVTITFLTPMNPEATERSVSVAPEVAGEFSWRGSTLVFTPDEDWPMETEVTVSVTRDARSWLMRRMERGFAFAFTTIGPPSIVATEPSQEARFVYSPRQLTIEFSRPMDHESVESRFSITPEISGQRLTWSDEQLVVSGEFSPSTEYRVSIGRNARDAAQGLRTAEHFEWTFVTTERAPHLALEDVGREMLLTAEVSGTLKLGLLNVSRVDFDLYPVDVSTYISMTNLSSEEWGLFAPEETPLTSWSIEPEVAPDRDENLALDLEPMAPGIYLLAARSPEGARDSQLLVATRTALTLKRTPSQALVWATSMEDGHPLEGLAVDLYDESGDLLDTGTTDGDGIFFTDLSSQPEQLYAVAQGEDGLSLCSDSWDEGIEPWRFDQVLWRWASQVRAYTVFLYTDRPAYTPGQTVSFRAILRRDDDGSYSLPAVGTVVQMTAANSKGNVIYDADLETSPFGTVHGAFALNDEVEPGEYFLEAVIGAEEYRLPFQIEERGEAPFTVDVAFDQEEYMTGEVVSATVTAGYHFGVPVEGATVEYTVYGSAYQVPWGEGDVGPGSCEGASCEETSRREIASGTGITDGAGKFGVLLRADTARQESSQVLTLEATVTELGGEEVSGEASAVVHRGEFYIDLQPDRSVVTKGQRASVEVRTLDVAGQYQAELELSYTVEVSEWEKVPTTVQGLTYWDWREIVSTVETSTVTTDAEGKAQISFVPRQGGPYRVEARGRDGRGNQVLASAQLWVSDPDRKVAWRFSEDDRIELIPDKASYQPDETARVLIQSPYDSALGLVTVERGGILSHSVSELKGNSPIVEIPLEDSYAPNVFVSVVLVPRGRVASPGPGFKVGYAELSVQAPQNVLQVTVTPDERRYEPGRMASLTIRTRDYLGRPVRSEVSLEVVDDSVQSDAGEARPGLVETFYGPRSLAVRTMQSLVVYAERARVVEDYGGAEGVAEQEPGQVLPELAYWNPAIVTDEAGTAVVTFQIPDDAARWQVLAEGVTLEGLVGAAEEQIISQKALVAVPSVPRLLYVGDEAIITGSVENHAGDVVQARVTLAPSDGLGVLEGARSVVIGPDESVTLEWTVEAEEAGDATLTMIAEADPWREVVQTSVSVQPFGERTVVLDAHVVQGEASQAVSVPAGVEGADLDVDVAPTLAAALIDSVEYLSDSPYDSVEQTVSRFLPALELARVLSEQGLDSEQLLPQLSGSVESSLQRLYRTQNRDGGWGWAGGDESQVSQTAYVILGLDRARRAGYEVNERAMSAGLGFLRQSVLEARSVAERAYVSYVLAECGHGDLSLARSLSERRRRMDPYAQAYLALALHSLGDSQTAQQIVEELAAKVIETANTAHWTEEEHDLSAMSSDGQTTATVLQAMLAVDADNPLAAKSVRWLMWGRQGGYWHTTHETAEVVLALAAWMEAWGQPEESFEYQVLLNGEVQAAETASAENIGSHLELSVSDLAPGDSRLEIVAEDPGVVYVATALGYFARTETLEAARSLDGPIVERRYEDPVTGEPLTGCRVGDLIRVRLTIELPEDGWYVVVEDPLPSGTEPVDVGAKTTAAGGGEGVGMGWRVIPYDGRTVFYAARLARGAYEYTYLLRATAVGQFKAMPAEVSLMYAPDIWGRSASSALHIDRRP